MKYFPELEEEKYQSLVSVPLVLKGDRMIGVIALHAEAPRVFSSEDAAFLIHVASLVAHAIENARLYERTRRSLRELEHLSRLGAAIARSESIDDLLLSAVEVGRTLVRAESLGIYLVEASGDSLRLRAAAGGDVEGPEVVSLPDLGMELRRVGLAGREPAPRCSPARSGARRRCARRWSRRSSPARRCSASSSRAWPTAAARASTTASSRTRSRARPPSGSSACS